MLSLNTFSTENVHMQNTAHFVNALIDADVDFRLSVSIGNKNVFVWSSLCNNNVIFSF